MSAWAGVTTPPTVWTASCWTTPSMGATSRWIRARCEALTTSWESDAARVSTSASSARRVRLNSISTTCHCVAGLPQGRQIPAQTVPGHGQLLDLLHALLFDLQILQSAHEFVVEQLPVGRGALGQHRHDQLQPLAVRLGRLDGRLALLDEEARGFEPALVLAPLVEQPLLLQRRQLGVDALRRLEPWASVQERPESLAVQLDRQMLVGESAQVRVAGRRIQLDEDLSRPHRLALVHADGPDDTARPGAGRPWSVRWE